MFTIKNKFIPFGDYTAVTIWPFIFAKTNMSAKTLNHEKIHGEQQKELLLVIFYILYVFFWVKGLIKYWSFNDAYYYNPFELEACAYQWDENYIETRKRFAWIKQI